MRCLWRTKLGFAAMGLACGTLMSVSAEDTDAKKTRPSEEGPSWKQKIQGNYENRIREMSAPEKVFEYFASVQKKGSDEWYMTPRDFISSHAETGEVSRSDEYNAKEESLPASVGRLMDLADPNGDGLISFSEYVFFTTLLSIPEKYFEIAFKMIDENGDGVVDALEFQKVMGILMCHNPVANATSSPQSWKPSSTIDEAILLPAWFGEDKKGSVDLPQFTSFMSDLHSAVTELYFDSLDYEKVGTISARDFAMSLVNFTTARQLPKYVDRVKRVESNPSRISFKDFQNWQTVLGNVDEIDEALEIFIAGRGAEFNISQLKRAAKAVASVDLKDEHLEILLAVFDDDGNGTLNHDEFVGVLRKARSLGIAKPRDFGLTRFFRCFADCTSGKD